MPRTHTPVITVRTMRRTEKASVSCNACGDATYLRFGEKPTLSVRDMTVLNIGNSVAFLCPSCRVELHALLAPPVPVPTVRERRFANTTESAVLLRALRMVPDASWLPQAEFNRRLSLRGLRIPSPDRQRIVNVLAHKGYITRRVIKRSGETAATRSVRKTEKGRAALRLALALDPTK